MKRGIHVNLTETNFLELVPKETKALQCPVCKGTILLMEEDAPDAEALIDWLNEHGDKKVCDGSLKWQEFSRKYLYW